MFENYRADVVKTIISRAQFRPFPKYEDRKEWKAIPEDYRAFLIHKGEEYLGYEWPNTTASVYMDFYRNGNRSRYEDIVFHKRRLPLEYLVAAECCEGEGRFIDDIINGVWTTLDEASWVIPAHNNYSIYGSVSRPLPDTENEENMYIDLFAAECGAVMSWIYYMLGDRLGEVAAQVPERMLNEINRRILVPFMKHTDFGWMGYHGNPVNNWNPWIVSNIMTTAGFACTDETSRTSIILKCLECLEFFLNGYTPDGGCDEGPGYWSAAGAALFGCVDILSDLTGGKVDLSRDDLVRNICAYIYRVHISGHYYVNYADAKPNVYPMAAMIYRMGEKTGDKNLTRMGSALYHQQRESEMVFEMSGVGCNIYRQMKQYFINKKLAKDNNTAFPLVRDVWLPGIQVMAAREKDGTDRGLYFSAKGGHNAESHNHNDVGSCVIYCDGKPAIIDIGTGVYEKKTFSPQRYEILQMQSQYHNLPIIGGEGEHNGREFAAQDVSYTCEDDAVHFGLDLRDAYTKDAGIDTWKRTYDFDRKAKEITLRDVYALQEAKEISFVFITPVRPTFTHDTMTLTLDEETQLKAVFDPSLTPEVEIFDTGSDANLRDSWGEQVYRTRFVKKAEATGDVRFVFSQK